MSKLNDSLEWIAIAKSNLEIGKTFTKSKPKNIRYEDLCFELQQCVEKALKAVLLYKGIKITKTHSIGYLLEQLSSVNVKIPDKIKESAKLTSYSVETRYPGDFYKIKKAEYLSVVKIAQNVYDWAKDYLGDLF